MVDTAEIQKSMVATVESALLPYNLNVSGLPEPGQWHPLGRFIHCDHRGAVPSKANPKLRLLVTNDAISDYAAANTELQAAALAKLRELSLSNWNVRHQLPFNDDARGACVTIEPADLGV